MVRSTRPCMWRGRSAMASDTSARVRRQPSSSRRRLITARRNHANTGEQGAGAAGAGELGTAWAGTGAGAGAGGRSVGGGSSSCSPPHTVAPWLSRSRVVSAASSRAATAYDSSERPSRLTALASLPASRSSAATSAASAQRAAASRRRPTSSSGVCPAASRPASQHGLGQAPGRRACSRPQARTTSPAPAPAPAASASTLTPFTATLAAVTGAEAAGATSRRRASSTSSQPRSRSPDSRCSSGCAHEHAHEHADPHTAAHSGCSTSADVDGPGSTLVSRRCNARRERKSMVFVDVDPGHLYRRLLVNPRLCDVHKSAEFVGVSYPV
ncbi:Microtubule-actin cross-linking factor 1 [Frankliniella fusca]|uniref:Microtubule-actin cross-linking factor 1 n=1 Tax=Frankliniella fusca TaxID=407009 RepID=A0AAE1H4G6_9NEOP|nr:Microtubule-actin cross-linking factor 1 [Frankliniella fusca]